MLRHLGKALFHHGGIPSIRDLLLTAEDQGANVVAAGAFPGSQLENAISHLGRPWESRGIPVFEADSKAGDPYIIHLNIAL